MGEWFPALRGALEERGIPFPKPYPHTWRTVLGSAIAAFITWIVFGMGYMSYFVVNVTLHTVGETAFQVSRSVNETINSAQSAERSPDDNATVPATTTESEITSAAEAAQPVSPSKTELLTPATASILPESAVPPAPPVEILPVLPPDCRETIREAILKNPLPFRESADLLLTDAVKQTDFAVLQAILRLHLDKGRVHLLTSQYMTRGTDFWHMQRIRLYLPMTVEEFIIALEESLEVWAERTVLTREGSDKLVLSVDGVRTHELWLTSTGEHFPLRPTEEGPRITIVIDDLGETLHTAEALIQLNVPITFSIWPFAARAQDVAKAAHKADREILIHQPMQPVQSPFLKAGPGELTLALSADEIRKNLNHSIASVPYAVGMNNHMGSRITQDADASQIISETLATAGLFALDSLTHPKSIFYDVAREYGIPAYRRAVFLDDGARTEQSVLAELKRAETIARTKGQAIAIGHPHPETIAALKTWIATRDQSITLVPLRYLSVPLEMLHIE